MRTDQIDHDAMVRKVIENLSRNGHEDIRADLPDYPKPDLIVSRRADDGRLPDITSRKDNRKYLFEIETEDSIEDDHTTDEWASFCMSAQTGSNLFVVVVPRAYSERVRHRASALKLNVDIIWGFGD